MIENMTHSSKLHYCNTACHWAPTTLKEACVSTVSIAAALQLSDVPEECPPAGLVSSVAEVSLISLKTGLLCHLNVKHSISTRNKDCGWDN